MKKEIADIVTDRIIEAMEAGIVPWRKPWSGNLTSPTSLSSGKTYRGINNLILSITAEMEAYETGLWGTYRQFQAMDGSVTKGEKGTPVVLWKPLEKETPTGETETFMMMRYFTVFNIAQTDVEVPEKYLVERTPVPVLEGLNEAINYQSGPKVIYKSSDRAFYNSASDQITLPELDQFSTAVGFAGTVLHELTHSTGHESRLDRKLANSFGCADYALEELVAEMGAAMLATQLDIEVEWDQAASYLDSWLKVLKDDRKLIIQAAQKAQKAVDVILPVAIEVQVAA